MLSCIAVFDYRMVYFRYPTFCLAYQQHTIPWHAQGSFTIVIHLGNQVIANFRSGNINLLVSTTVGEEGIDIPDCKYVIKYDVCGNEIASVQSRGRVRDTEGKYEVVAGKETGVIEKENLNVIREEMMQDAIKEVKAMAEQEYREKV